MSTVFSLLFFAHLKCTSLLSITYELLSEEKSNNALMMICAENLAKIHVQYTVNMSQR